MIRIIENYFFWLILYSVFGWIYESFICSLEARHFINRGFLNGPYCPIYGFGAVFDILILGRIENAFLLFLLGSFLTCTLEYVTSLAMEKLFHARWWDYSNMRFNINGRVCLIGAIVFGILSVLVIKVIHPSIVQFTAKIPKIPFHILNAALLILFIIDCMITIKGFNGFNKTLKELAEALEQLESKVKERIHDSAAFETASSVYAHFAEKLSSQQHRMIAAFPKLKTVHNNKILSNLRKYAEKIRKNKKF